MEHGADKFDRRRFVGILLFEMHHEPECAVLEGGVSGADDDGVPASGDILLATNLGSPRVGKELSQPYHVMTLSGTGDAETPAGGSVCMRWQKS